MSFVMPRNGTVTGIAATFSLVSSEGDTLIPEGATVTVHAQLYSAPPGSNVFTAIGEVLNLTPTFTDPLTPVDVTVGIRLLFVFYATATDLPSESTASVYGYASGRINIQ